MITVGIRGFAQWIAAFCFVFLLQACASVAYLPGQQTVGRLRTVGPNVYVNDKRARDGQMVRVQDRLRTGPDSSAFLYFLDGGLLQLDENTEPYPMLVWDGTKCTLKTVGLRFGQAYQEAGDQCSQAVSTDQAEWTQQKPGENPGGA